METESVGAKARWQKKAQAACKSTLKMQRRIYQGGLPEALRLQGRYLWLTGKMADAQKCWHQSLSEAEKLEMRYEAGMTHLEIGERLGEQDQLQMAKTIFAAINAEQDLTKARDLLRKYTPPDPKI